MANVAHSTLTGSDLHEPKGADTATADKVYVSNGAGSGTWQKITSSQLTGSGNPFGSQLLHVRDEKPAGTFGGNGSNGNWQTRTLNTVKTNEISGASLASNQITLPAGTYYCEFRAPYYNTNAMHKARLRNITDGSTLIVGNSIYNNAGSEQSDSLGFGRFTLAGTKVLEVQHYSDNSPTNCFGNAYNVGEVEIYSEILIWKIS